MQNEGICQAIRRRGRVVVEFAWTALHGVGCLGSSVIADVAAGTIVVTGAI